MSTAPQLLPGAIAELFAQAAISGNLTLADRYGLLAAVLEETPLSEEERDALNRLIRAIQRGHLKAVDELSALL